VPFSYLTHVECPRCQRRYDASQLNGVCQCGAPMLARYDLSAAGASLRPADLVGRAPSLWRYHELLPVQEADHIVSLGEGMTPLVPLPGFGAAVGVPRLVMKDEGLIPTGSFKARGAAVGVSRAAELGAKGVAMPTNGNAGAAWSLYAARAGLRSLIVMPVDAPLITRNECLAAGAELYLVNGLISDAGQIVGKAVASSGGALTDVSTLKEPYRIEGKKTMGYEIAEQLGWRLPDVIVYPTGGGVGLIGIYKALQEMAELGWIDGSKLPRLVAVQAAGCAPVVQAFERGELTCQPWPDARTVAFGITVPKPLGDFLILDALRTTGGTALAVEDEAILADLRECARLDGEFLCPEGAACLSAVRSLRASGWLGADEEVMILNTGLGVKYPNTIQAQAPVLNIGDTIPPSS
jgi:threonine synthase